MKRERCILPTPDADEFAPFGELIQKPQGYGQRQFYSRWLGGVEGLSPIFHTNRMTATALPAEVTKLERHKYAAQCFVPLDVARFLVTVAPSLADGSPDVDGLRSYLIPADMGVIYSPGTWHAGASVLDHDGSFAVLMWRGQGDDDEFVEIEPVTLCDQAVDA